jgi:hypothetical protein
MRGHIDPPGSPSLGIVKLLRAYSSELPVDEARAHFALEHVVAPVTHVLQQQLPRPHISGRVKGGPVSGC